MEKNIKTQKKPNFLSKILDKGDFLSLLDFSLKVIISGFTLNLALLIFNVPLSILNVISLGSLLWFLDTKFVPLIRRLWFRK